MLHRNSDQSILRCVLYPKSPRIWQFEKFVQTRTSPISLTSASYERATFRRFLHFMSSHLLARCVARGFFQMYQSNPHILKVVMDCYALFFLTLNALSRQEIMSQGIMNILLRDGLQFLLVSSVSRLFALQHSSGIYQVTLSKV